MADSREAGDGVGESGGDVGGDVCGFVPISLLRCFRDCDSVWLL